MLCYYFTPRRKHIHKARRRTVTVLIIWNINDIWLYYPFSRKTIQYRRDKISMNGDIVIYNHRRKRNGKFKDSEGVGF